MIAAAVITGSFAVIAAILGWYKPKSGNQLIEEEYEERITGNGTSIKKTKRKYK